MSANNYILIKEVKPNLFIVAMKDMDTEATLGWQRTIRGLRNAINEAMAEIQDVEYGIVFDLSHKE